MRSQNIVDPAFRPRDDGSLCRDHYRTLDERGMGGHGCEDVLLSRPTVIKTQLLSLGFFWSQKLRRLKPETFEGLLNLWSVRSLAQVEVKLWFIPLIPEVFDCSG